MVESVRVLGAVAGVLSLFTLLACLVSVPGLIGEIASIRQELDSDMAAFRLLSNDAWKDMMVMGGSRRTRRQVNQFFAKPPEGGYGDAPAPGAPPPAAPGSGPLPSAWVPDSPDVVAPGNVNAPNPSLAGPAELFPIVPPAPVGPGAPPSAGGPQCNCDSRPNTCPAGPPGEKGSPGTDGPDGPDGLDGVDGADAEDAQAARQELGCTNCPPGTPGPPGTDGRGGPRGMRGAAGQRGQDGMPGRPGAPGTMGDVGEEGPLGGAGLKGDLGADVQNPVGIPGPKGELGEAGEAGDEGEAGKDAEDGVEGAEGPAGPQGPLGKAGEPGDIGPPGFDGEAGMPLYFHICFGRNCMDLFLRLGCPVLPLPQPPTLQVSVGVTTLAMTLLQTSICKSFATVGCGITIITARLDRNSRNSQKFTVHEIALIP